MTEIKNILKYLFPDRETKKKKIIENLEQTLNEIRRESISEKPDEYFLNRLNKQYRYLLSQSKKYGINTQEYVNAINTGNLN